ncbi:hypothetical protein H9P43_000472 [Blastocladiella emersonii ATCC 22665]|nr:hypothetical protein H9P43_000472 [Blastocladiella emersonii ATCC 22665]
MPPTIIQSVYRSYRSRKLTLRAMQEHARMQDRMYYDHMATRIQKVWRGYWSRQIHLDFAKRKAYLHAVAEKSASVRQQLDEYEAVQELQFNASTRRTLKTKQTEIATRVHHLLGTHSVPGVFAPQLVRPRSTAPKHVSFYNHRPLSPTVLPKLPQRRESVTTHAAALPLASGILHRPRVFGQECGTPLGTANSAAGYLSRGSDDMLYNPHTFSRPEPRMALGPREVKLLALAESVLGHERDAWRTYMEEATIRAACTPLILDGYRRRGDHRLGGKADADPWNRAGELVVDQPAGPREMRLAPDAWKRGIKQ